MLSKEECENALYGICSSTAKAEYRKVFYELIKEHFDNKSLIKCEKCGKEMEFLMVNEFNHDGSDSLNQIPYKVHRKDCISVMTDGNWTGYELSEEEMLETIKCPHCGKYPFEETEISVHDEVEIVMFPIGE